MLWGWANDVSSISCSHLPQCRKASSPFVTSLGSQSPQQIQGDQLECLSMQSLTCKITMEHPRSQTPLTIKCQHTFVSNLGTEKKHSGEPHTMASFSSSLCRSCCTAGTRAWMVPSYSRTGHGETATLSTTLDPGLKHIPTSP